MKREPPLTGLAPTEPTIGQSINRRQVLGGLGVLLGAISGCMGSQPAGQTTTESVSTDTPFELTSNAFEEGEQIPVEYSCDGSDRSPPLSIANVPDATDSMALIVDDPDAPGGTFTHWFIWNIPPDQRSIPADIADTETIDTLGGARQGTNDFGDTGYGGPCPPAGSTHTYRFTVYALDSNLDVEAGRQRDTVQSAIDAARIDADRLTATYSR